MSSIKKNPFFIYVPWWWKGVHLTGFWKLIVNRAKLTFVTPITSSSTWFQWDPRLQCPVSIYFWLLYYSLAISFYKTLTVTGVLGLGSHFGTLGVVMNCYCSMKSASSVFSAFGLVLKNGYCPNTVTFTKDCFWRRKWLKLLVCIRRWFSWGVLLILLPTTLSSAVSVRLGTPLQPFRLQLHRKMVHDKYGYARLSCKQGPIVDMKELLIEMDSKISPDVISYNCLIDGLCRSGMIEDAESLFVEMADHGVDLNLMRCHLIF